MRVSKWRGVVAGFACVTVIGAGVRHAWTCIGQMVEGVHYNTVVPDFGVPPQVAVWGHDGPIRPGTWDVYRNESSEHYEAEEAESIHEERLERRLVREAREADAHRHYRRAVALYRRLFNEGLGTESYWRDRVEVLQQVLRLGAPTRLGDYVRARNRFERGDLWPAYVERIRDAMAAIAADPRAGFLRPHALYTIAIIDWNERPDAHTARLFADCAKLYPRSPRAESALIMAARTYLYDREDGERIPKTDLEQGRACATMLLVKHPQSRFNADALGWIARVEYLMGRYGSARIFYRRQLAAGGPQFGTTESIGDCYLAQSRRDLQLATYLRQYAAQPSSKLKSIAARYVLLAVDHLGEKDIVPLCRMLRGDVGLLRPYLECRLYFTDAAPEELTNLVRLSEAALRVHPRAELGAAILARLSEIAYLRKDYRAALQFARRAMRRRAGRSADLDLALYVQGSALNKLGCRSAARRSYETLIRRYPNSRLVGGTRENLALIYERDGLLSRALTQYLALDYSDDVAFMLDVRMPPKQIESFIRSCPRQSQRALAVYALGMRYLRRNRFNLALNWFGRLTQRQRLGLAGLVGHSGDWWFSRGDDEWLRDPKRTALDLRRLHAAYRSARGKERKARAVYALASYYRAQGNLVLYNYSLWKGSRAADYGFYWNYDVESAVDKAAWKRHCYEHESLARTRALCLEILRRYPRTSVAARAAYTAATCCFRLSDFNDWWRMEDSRARLGDQSVRLMNVVVRRYPKSKLRKSAEKYLEVYKGEIAGRFRYPDVPRHDKKRNSRNMGL